MFKRVRGFLRRIVPCIPKKKKEKTDELYEELIEDAQKSVEQDVDENVIPEKISAQDPSINSFEVTQADFMADFESAFEIEAVTEADFIADFESAFETDEVVTPGICPVKQPECKKSVEIDSLDEVFVDPAKNEEFYNSYFLQQSIWEMEYEKSGEEAQDLKKILLPSDAQMYVRQLKDPLKRKVQYRSDLTGFKHVPFIDSSPIRRCYSDLDLMILPCRDFSMLGPLDKG